MALLKKMGVPDNLARAFVDVGMKRGDNPILLATIAAKESGGGRYSAITQNPKGQATRRNTNGTLDYGAMQINSGNAGMWAYAHQGTYQNIDAGAIILNRKLRGAHGDLNSALSAYGGGRASYASDITGILQGGLGLPSRAMSAIAVAAQDDLSESAAAFATLVPIAKAVDETFVEIVNAGKSLINLIDAGETALQRLLGMRSPASGAARGAPAGHYP